MVWRKGLFGTIEVKDEADARNLYLNGQRQGGSYFEPSAYRADESLSQDDPGPCANSAYAMGWLLGALMNPQGNALMVGLGSGAGAVQMLFNFPNVHLTIVEIDPEMVRLALAAYPLLDHLMDKGCLDIVIEDATEYLTRRYDKWDVGFADAFTGEADLKDDYLDLLCDRCDHVYLNCIDVMGGDAMKRHVTKLMKKGKEVADIIQALPTSAPPNYSGSSNYIITTQEPDWKAAHEFLPFADFAPLSYGVRMVQEHWDYFLVCACSSEV